MRLVGNIQDQKLASRFSLFLQKENIDNEVEKSFDKKDNKEIFTIWVHNEDLLNMAKNHFDDFIKEPKNPKFDVNEAMLKKDSEEKSDLPIKDPMVLQKSFPYKLTYFFLALCVILYFINFMQEVNIKKKYNLKQLVMLTPIQMLFLYDLPEQRLLLDDVIIKYKLDDAKKLENPPKEAQEEINKIEKKPAFMGLYEIVLQKLQKTKDISIKSPKLFEKILDGQVWRLFTPAVLHSGILHILFNMLWLWYLGKQIEPRLRSIRYFLFIIIIAVVSNTFQYLMGGPYFLGFSGIITGMVGYIYVRQKTAPWEGYNIPNAVFYFIGIFIFAMLFLQIAAFVFQVIKPKVGFTPGIANTAHIVGALAGMLLAKIPFFTWRPSE